MARWELTRATPADIGPLVALESRCFDYPWGQSSFEGELSASSADSRVAWTATATGEKQIHGYIFFRFIAEEVHIFRIAVDPLWRRRGIGTRLVSECLRAAHAGGLSTAVLEARPSNTEAIELYRKFGFRTAGTRRGYYSDRHEDALILKRTLT
jgi:ribosomal-protein-alanine N-acetyltransferase